MSKDTNHRCGGAHAPVIATPANVPKTDGPISVTGRKPGYVEGGDARARFEQLQKEQSEVTGPITEEQLDATLGTVATFDAATEAAKIAPLWPAFVKSNQNPRERFADFMAEHAVKNGWTVRQAFLVDYEFQDALDAYWETQDD